MNKEEIVRRTQGKKTYRPPSLSVYGRVSHLTASGSGTKDEGNSVGSGTDGEMFVTLITYRP